jgi:hypothetical protein
MKEEILRSFFGRSICQPSDKSTVLVLDASGNLFPPRREKEVFKNRSIGTKLMLSCVALIAGLCIPVHAQQQCPAIAVRSNGEADVVVEGPNNSLQYYWAIPGIPWREYTIPGDGTMSSPAIAVRSTGEADVVAVAYQALFYYWAFPGSVWQVAGLGSLETPQ